MKGGNNKLLGRWGESLVAEHLRKKGWDIVAAGYYTRFGEVDLIACKGKILAFVEVKLRKDDSFAPARVFVTPAKQAKLRTAAELYLAAHPTDLQPRFDVAEVYAPQGMETEKPVINYIENAF